MNTNEMTLDELMALPVHTDYILDEEDIEHHHDGDDAPAGEDPAGYVHHWRQGPGALRRYSSPVTRQSVEGTEHVCTHYFRYFLDPESVNGQPIKDGRRVATPSVESVAWKLRSILQSDKGWIRAGIRFYRVSNPANADVFVRISPLSDSACNANGGGAPGCYWTRDGTRYIHVAMDYFYLPQFIRTTNHEFGHASIWAHDMYKGEGHDIYNGVMGKLFYDGQRNYWPDEGDIETAILFKEGRAPIVHPRHR